MTQWQYLAVVLRGLILTLPQRFPIVWIEDNFAAAIAQRLQPELKLGEAGAGDGQRNAGEVQRVKIW